MNIPEIGSRWTYLYDGKKQDIVLELTDYGGLTGIEYCYIQVISDNRHPNERQPVGRRFKVNFDWFDDKIKI
jgi:hypothetical protein